MKNSTKVKINLALIILSFFIIGFATNWGKRRATPSTAKTITDAYKKRKERKKKEEAERLDIFFERLKKLKGEEDE